eukprot:gene9989-2308_t
MKSKGVTYNVGKFLCCLFWVVAYLDLIVESINNQQIFYSFVLCSVCTSWEIFYGIRSFDKPGSLMMKYFNLIYATLEIFISFCLVYYGNESTHKWNIWSRLLLFSTFFFIFYNLFEYFANSKLKYYDEKRHISAWLIVTFIPIFVSMEGVKLSYTFKICTCFGNFFGLFTISKKFSTDDLMIHFKITLIAQFLSTLIYCYFT